MNTDELDAALDGAERRVLKIQAKLHRWAREDPHRRFEDLFNLVADPAFLLVAWDRVRSNKGARTAGVDGQAQHTQGMFACAAARTANVARLAMTGAREPIASHTATERTATNNQEESDQTCDA